MVFDMTLTITGAGSAEEFGDLLLSALEERAGDLGPVISAPDRDDPRLDVALTVSAPSLAAAVGFATVVVDGAVRAAGGSPTAAGVVRFEAEQAQAEEPRPRAAIEA